MSSMLPAKIGTERRLVAIGKLYAKGHRTLAVTYSFPEPLWTPKPGLVEIDHDEKRKQRLESDEDA